MNRRLVTGLVVVLTTCGLGIVVACGGGEHPDAASDDPLLLDAGKRDASGSGVLFDVDLEKGIIFGDNGLVSCGTQAADRTITLKNTSDDIVNYTVAVTDGNDRYTVTPTSGGIPAGASATLKITPKAIPAASDVSTDLYAGTLEVKFPQLGVPPTNIRLHQTARGAIITSSIGDQLNLGSVKVGEVNEVPLILTNSGNVEATASFKLGTDVFTIDGTSQATVQVAAGGSESKKLKLAPVAAGDLSDTLAITYNSSAVFCKPPPAQIALSGKGTTSVGISKGTLDFGLVNCGSTAAPQTVDISSTVAMKFTAVLTKGAQSPYDLANDSDDTTVHPDDQNQIAQASTFKLRIAPKPMEQVSSTADNAFGDTLTITTDVPGDTPHVIILKEGAKGAILAFDAATIAVSGPVGSIVNTNFTLQNRGNVVVPYVITTNTTSGPGGTFTSTLTSGNAIIGDTKGVLQSKAPTTSGSTAQGTMSVSLGSGGTPVLCADLPPAMPLSVAATGSAITINPTNLNFGSVDCGLKADFQTVTLSSTVATNIKVSLGNGPSSPYTLADNSGTAVALNSTVAVGPGADYILRVVPKAVPIPSATNTNGLGDTLTLTSDIVTEPVRTVALTETAHGAVLTAPAKIDYANGGNGTLTIANSGNATARYTLSVSGPTVPNSSQTIDLLPGAHQDYTVSGGSGSITVSPASDTATYPLCITPPSTTVTQAPP